MNQNYIKSYISNAVDLIQIITEGVEDIFMGSSDNAAKARASMTISALYILGDYLQGICERGAET